MAELGSQNVWCPQRTMMRNLFRAFGRDVPADAVLDGFANWTGAARELYEHLGMRYACIDVDARFGSLTLDMNFDEVPAAHRDRYDLVTNHGTSEHILNQTNVFRMMHDLTRPGGLILHAVTFSVHLEHGFFNYDVDFFGALARANGYRSLGVWVGPDWQLGSLVPWHPALMAHMAFSARTTHLLVVLQRKAAAGDFRPPLGDGVAWAVEWSASPYCHAVDAEHYEGSRERFVSFAPGGAPTPPPRGASRAAPIDTAPDVLRLVAREAQPVALGAPVAMLYGQLKALGVMDSVHAVLELGGPTLACPAPILEELLRLFGRAGTAATLAVEAGEGRARSRDLYEALGLTCTTVDLAGGPGTLKLDLEFEAAPAEHANRYDLVANIGTGASLLNQQNVFAATHALARPGGLMLHVVPFKIPSRGALVGYQPNFFEALARYNSYRTLGTWVAVDAEVPALIPWQPSLLDYLAMSDRSAHHLVVCVQKMYPNAFCVPFQGCYETLVPAVNLARYRMVVDGNDSDGAAALARGKAPTPATPTPASVELHGVPGADLASELARRVRLRAVSLLAGRLRQALTRPTPGTRRRPAR